MQCERWWGYHSQSEYRKKILFCVILIVVSPFLLLGELLLTLFFITNYPCYIVSYKYYNLLTGCKESYVLASF